MPVFWLLLSAIVQIRSLLSLFPFSVDSGSRVSRAFNERFTSFCVLPLSLSLSLSLSLVLHLLSVGNAIREQNATAYNALLRGQNAISA